MTNVRTNETINTGSGGEYEKIIATPVEVRAIVRKASGRVRCFVRGSTPVLIEDSDSYLPLAPSARVTRKSFDEYLTEIVDSAERQSAHRNVTLLIELSIHGDCYFV